jgi:predicted enzyme related to lactoylglutathione lyase
MSSPAEAPSSTKTRTPLTHLPGHFYWADLQTSDIDGAIAFYAKLFGWTTVEIPGGPAPYCVAQLGGRSKSGLAQLAAGDAARPSWLAYLTVANVDDTLPRVEELGGTVLQPAFDVMDLGRMALVQDPTGATFALWNDTKPGQTTVHDEHGSSFWYEQHSTDIAASLAFYESLVEWESEPQDMGNGVMYYVVSTPDTTDPAQASAAGMMQQMPSATEAGVPSVWSVYFNVDDVDATAALAVEAGGTIVMPPMDIPGIGRSAHVADPQGAMFSIMTPIPRASE